MRTVFHLQFGTGIMFLLRIALSSSKDMLVLWTVSLVCLANILRVKMVLGFTPQCLGYIVRTISSEIHCYRHSYCLDIPVSIR